MPSLPNVTLPSVPDLWSKMRSLCVAPSRLSTPRTWRLSTAGKRPRATPPFVHERARHSSSSGRRNSLFPVSSPASFTLESSSSLDDFELLSVLGRGTFGVVRLARHRASGRAVAIKILDRDDIHALKQEVNILREQSVHLKLKHAFISRIYTTFQDTHAVYFVLEYCPGGEVYSLVYDQEEDDDDDELLGETLEQVDLKATSRNRDEDTCTTDSESSSSSDDDSQPPPSKETTRKEPALSGQVAAPLAIHRTRSHSVDNASRKRALRDPAYGGLREPHVAFYMACLVSAVAYLHDTQNVLYRDLKLENLVIGEDGYPKLIDFGLSKPEAARAGDRNTTMCGSAEYMAPEIVLREPYGASADLWSLGVLMYELFFGATPFYHPNAREQSRRICEASLTFPHGFEDQYPHATQLMRALLNKNPRARPASCAQLRRDPFFSCSFFPTSKSWRQLESKQIRAPFVPQLTGAFDTSLFANAYEEEEDDDDEKDGLASY